MQLISNSGLFDPCWYLEQYPDVQASGVDAVGAIRHFIRWGASEGRNPNRFFATSWYVASNPDVTATGLNPLVHYLQIGAARGSDPSPRFQTCWYLRTYPDVANAKINPLQHYLIYGMKEGRRPSAAPCSIEQAQLVCLKQPIAVGEVALFVSHSPDGHLKEHVRYYLEELVRHGIKTTLIVASDRPFIDLDHTLLALVDGLYVRENYGFDFAAWAHVLHETSKLYSAEVLYLLNDSVIGPLNEKKFARVLHKLRNSNAAVVGLTDNYERRWHIQSYFIAVKSAAFRALKDFMEEVTSFSDKEDVINAYEINLTTAFRDSGFSAEVLFPSTENHNATLFGWKELIQSGFPFIKVATLRGQFPGADISNWQEVLQAEGFDLKLAQGAIFPAAPREPNPRHVGF